MPLFRALFFSFIIYIETAFDLVASFCKLVTVPNRSQLNEIIKSSNYTEQANEQRTNERASAHVIVDRGIRRFLCVERLNISIKHK